MLVTPTTEELGAIGSLHAIKHFELAMELAELSDKKFEKRVKGLNVTVLIPEPSENRLAVLLRIFRNYQLRQKAVEAELRSSSKNDPVEARV